MSSEEPDQRRRAREPSRFAVTCRSPGGQSAARLRDIAAIGCSVSTDEAILVQGHRVRLQIAQLSAIEGEVIWHDGLDAGIAFAEPLHAAVVEFIALRLDTPSAPDSAMIHRDRFGRALPALGDPGRGFGQTRTPRAP